MAKKTFVRVVDDIDGTDAERTVQFSIGRKDYEIDLSKENGRRFDAALKPFIEAGRAVPRRRGPRKPGGALEADAGD